MKDSSLSMSQQNRQVNLLEIKNAFNDGQTNLSNIFNVLYKVTEQQNAQVQGIQAQLEKLTPKSAKTTQPDFNKTPKIKIDTKKKK